MDTQAISEISTAIYAAGAGIIVAAIIKLVNKFLDRGSNELSVLISLRKELRDELDHVKSELSKVQSDLDTWKDKYYEQTELVAALRISIIQLINKLNKYNIYYRLSETGSIEIISGSGDVET